MIHRDFEEPKDHEWFKRWKAAASNAAAKAAQEFAAACASIPPRAPEFDFEKPRFEKKTIWGALKPHLIALFHGKCAYCESAFEVVSFGDVEHYRPKGRVDEEDQNGMTQPINGHHGYYWLAYAPMNLLPACSRCNGRGGKMNLFPLADPTQRVPDPAGPLDRESPLLLNPYQDFPEKHLRNSGSEKRTGESEFSSSGTTSITVYGLDRSTLTDRRCKEQEFQWGRLMNKLSLKNIDEALAILNDIDAGVVEYSAAVTVEVDPLRQLARRYLPRTG